MTVKMERARSTEIYLMARLNSKCRIFYIQISIDLVSFPHLVRIPSKNTKYVYIYDRNEKSLL